MSKQIKNNTDIRALSTGELKALLCRELDRKRIDHDQVQQLLAVLRERDEMGTAQIPEQIARKWQTLQQEKIVPDRNAVWRKGRRAVRIAAVLVLVFTLTLMVPRALGAENVFSVLGRWTDDFFSFVAPGEPAATEQEYVFRTDNPELQQVYDAVTAVGITYPVVPTWLPEGYKLKTLESPKTSTGYIVTADFHSETSNILFSCIIRPGPSGKFCKDEGEPVMFEYNGVVYYLMTNAGKHIAVWSLDDLECVIVAPDQKTLYSLVRSIHLEV